VRGEFLHPAVEEACELRGYGELYPDTIIVVKMKDVVKASESLTELIKGERAGLEQ
jgi:hypothetical protein